MNKHRRRRRVPLRRIALWIFLAVAMSAVILWDIFWIELVVQ